MDSNSGIPNYSARSFPAGKKTFLLVLLVVVAVGTVLLSSYMSSSRNFTMMPRPARGRLNCSNCGSDDASGTDVKVGGATGPPTSSSDSDAVNVNVLVSSINQQQKDIAYTGPSPNRDDRQGSNIDELKQDASEITTNSNVEHVTIKSIPSEHSNVTVQGFSNAIYDISKSTLGPYQTLSTLDPHTPITCRPGSPYVLCDGPPKMRTPVEKAADAAKHSPYKIVVARRCDWYRPLNFSECWLDNCVDGGKVVTSDTDHVHMCGVNLKDLASRLPRLNPAQTLSWGMQESPFHTQTTINGAYQKAFNYTMTYRQDSDIFIPYGFLAFQPTPMKERPDYLKIAKEKTGTVAWIVSNCQTESLRMKYVRELQKYIDIDIYGNCGNVKCDLKGHAICRQDLLSSYKFYLSFENSFCRDYVTEKLFKVFIPDLHIIPVTRNAFGTRNRELFPADTFVDASQFSTPRDLAGHLKSLAADVTRFAKMLEVKDQYRWVESMKLQWCYLCEFLNTNGDRKKVADIHGFWNRGHCQKPTDLNW